MLDAVCRMLYRNPEDNLFHMLFDYLVPTFVLLLDPAAGAPHPMQAACADACTCARWGGNAAWLDDATDALRPPQPRWQAPA
jgi:hypothetical protein